jgi:hypothetical protein
MQVRNRIVPMLGLKDIGRMGALDNTKSVKQYQVGDKVGIFSLLFISENEVILGDSDRRSSLDLSRY